MIMSKIHETGIAKNVANANLLITYISQLATLYQPSNPAIELATLKTIYQQAYDYTQQVNSALPPYTLATKERALIFEPINKKLAKLRRVYKSTKGVSEAQLEAFMTIARKYRGARKNTPTTSTTPENEQNQHSVAQLSFDQRSNTFTQLIELLQSTPNYAPNETEYQVTTLQNEKDLMMEATQKVADNYFPLSLARGKRNKVMYTDKLNLVDTFNIAKDYLFTILDTKSPEYKAISRLKFKKQ